MPDTSPAPQKSLSISPATADVNPNAVCHFVVDPPGTEVAWDIKPKIGEIDRNGIYTSPKEIAMPQSVIVTATTMSGQSATAAIELTDAPARIRWLGWYAIVVGGLLGIGILAAWNQLYRPPSPLLVIVNPPVITLDPGKDDRFTFVATVLGDARNAVTWSVEGGGEIESTGTFRQKLDPAPGIDKAVKITAKSMTDPTQTGTAIVHLLSGRHLEIVPQTASVFTSQQVPFRTPNAAVKWSVSRSDIASISPDGMFTAGGVSQRIAIVQVTAWGGKPHEQAAAAVVMTSPLGTSDFANWPLMLFVIMCGALGSMVYYASSFVSYVGNRTFRASWFWFYISRPFVGGALAVIFYFIVGSGMVNGATVAELMKLGMVSALVGLFSDKAVKKLSDILDVLLATKEDRKDKVTETKPQTPAAAAQPTAQPPKVVSANPATISPNAAATVELTGSNFKTGFKVKVNGLDATPIQQTEQSFKLDISAAQAQAPKVVITVTTDQGTVVFDLPVQ
jgi:hypothetical protein